MDPEAIRPPVVSVGKTRIPRNSHAFIRREIRVEGVGEKTGMDPRDLIRIAESLAEGSRCGDSDLSQPQIAQCVNVPSQL